MTNGSRTNRWFGALSAALSATALLGAAPTATKADPAYKTEIDAWHQKRVERLKSPNGWLAVVGLSWLKPGDNPVGSADGSAVILPKSAPAKVGNLRLTGKSVQFIPADGAGATIGGKPAAPTPMVTDAGEGEPTTITAGTASFFAIERAGKVGIRVKDAKAPAIATFRGIERYPVDPKWKVEAKWEPYAPSKKVQTHTVIGTVDEETSPGVAVFTLDGQSFRLEPVLEEGSDELFFVFGDATNGRTTYGGGRFLYTPMPKDGKVVLDFNKSYNPPCCFTDFATCPMPRPYNRIAARIEAGEKGYKGGAKH